MTVIWCGAAGGNLSAWFLGSDTFVVTATGVALRDVARENLLAIDSLGKVLEGPPDVKPSKETSFHLAVYEVRPDVSAIHVTPHPCNCVRGKQPAPVPTVTISAQLKLKQGKLIPVARPGSKELADLVAQSVKTSPIDCSIFLFGVARHALPSAGLSVMPSISLNWRKTPRKSRILPRRAHPTGSPCRAVSTWSI